MTACAYCGYMSICQFDTRLTGNNYRNLYDRKDDEVWALMGSRSEEGGDSNGSDK
jgi:ATP-dependent helicase/nuclease subunit B